MTTPPPSPGPRREPLELLAPAGDREAMRAAVANGADAVYFGLAGFNARARAANFTVEELPGVMAELHARNVRGFVALNTLAFPDELPDVATIIAACAEAGVDAVIVQDLGVVRLAQAMAPSLPVHASTQMTLTESRGVEFARRLGVSRVVLARELSAADIRKVTSETGVPVEVFVHGALCVAYSGQCLTSEAIGGRSANRGQCAQACRLPYELVVDGAKVPLGDRSYLLSPRDLAAHDHIAELVEAGVTSFKIEGRLKGAPYVAQTTQTYRRALDAALGGVEFKLDAAGRRDLEQVFSRGLSPGFLEGTNHQTLVRGRVPKSRGVLLGTVVASGPKFVRVRLRPELPAPALSAGDGVLFDLGRPDTDEPGGRVWKVIPAAGPGGAVELRFDPAAPDWSAVPAGAEAWKTDDPALKKRLEQSYSQDKLARRAPVDAALSGSLGGAVVLSLSDDAGRRASATWPGPLEAARGRGTTPEEARGAVGRLGATPFELRGLAWDLPAGVLLPSSVLNGLRREASEALAANRLAAGRHTVIRPGALAELRAARPAAAADASPARLNLLVRSPAQLEAVAAWALREALGEVTCDYEDPRRYKESVARCRELGVTVHLAPPRVWKPGEDGLQALICRAEPDGVLVRNLAGIDYFRDALPGRTLVGDFSLNAANDLSVGLLIRAGLSRVVPSFDLNWGQFQSLAAATDPAWLEPVVHQQMPMFHNEFCIYANTLSTGKDYRDCGRPCDRHRIDLEDRTGARFPVVADAGCRNTVYHHVPQSAAEYVGRMLALGVRHFRVDLLREAPPDVGPLLDGYARVAAGLDDGRAVWRQLRAVSQLGVTRGTLGLV